MTDNIKKINAILDILPQMQCKKCKYDDCESYSRAIVEDGEETDRCEPGSESTRILIEDIKKGHFKKPSQNINYKIAHIHVEHCIGCTICIKVCPVDAILGAKLKQHHIINEYCNGCELCINECPTECMTMIDNPDIKLWSWPTDKSNQSKINYYSKIDRIEKIKKVKEQKKQRLAENVNLREYVNKAIERESSKRKISKPMKNESIQKIFKILRKKNPEPKTDLNYKSKFQLLIAVILSAQATDKSVNAATKILFRDAKSPKEILNLGVKKLSSYIKTIGLYNAKAKHVIRTCEILLNKYGGRVPGNIDDLQSLPGVGRKTANVVLNNAFGQPTIGVDTHVFRVSNRLGIAPGKDVLTVEKKLIKNVPDEFKMHAHHWLILHGRYTCVARNPKCNDCDLTQFCKYRVKKTKKVKCSSL